MHFWYKKGYISFHGFCILSFEFLSIPTVFAIQLVLIRFRLSPDDQFVIGDFGNFINIISTYHMAVFIHE